MSAPASRRPRGAGMRARSRIARAGGFARTRGLVQSRAMRFARRTGGDTPDPMPGFGELAAWPAWPTLDPEARQGVFALAALLASRDALAGMICGEDLRNYAAPFGDDLFERALAMAGGGARNLPAPDALVVAGEDLARCGLPPSLARCLGESLAGEPEAARHVAEAEGLLRP